MSRFLRSIAIEHYGALEHRMVGPFAEGLNVVYGPNEAGKSTVASFVGGVLFGWEEAHGVRNTYQPNGIHRSGALEFADDSDEGSMVVSRAHNADGMKGDSALVADIDNATYRTLFHLTSDELRSLSNTSDVTARLLTAGSGTGSSPAAAFVEIEQRIAEHTSRSDDAAASIVRLGNMLEAKREEVIEAAEAVELSKQEDREWTELAERRATSAKQLGDMNARIESLYSARARLEVLDHQVGEKRSEMDSLLAERAAFEGERDNQRNAIPESGLLSIDAPTERALRDKLDEFSDEQVKVARALDTARENSEASTAAYEALLEIDEEDAKRARSLRNRTSQLIISVLLPIVFVAGGVPVFIHGRQISSLSFTALGIGMIVSAFFLAAAALVVLLRPNRGAEALEERRKDAQWVMLQERKKLDAGIAAQADFDARLGSYLSEHGLESAEGSLRQARALLDDARDARLRIEELRQRTTSVEMRIDAVKDALAALEFERRSITGSIDMPGNATLPQLDSVIRAECEQRDVLARALDDMNLRFGELGERLTQARKDSTFDQLKLEYQQILCELRERKHDLVTLMLAKRMLEKSIAAWESRSQPEVYELASQLFERMTSGAWSRISMTADGKLIATSAEGDAREVRHLSLGTCQQLYLSLRIAMLLHASDVGRAVPVLADDILVHFDSVRRIAAARALAQLAEARQVIVFTCHRETVAALREAQPGLNYLEL